MTSYGKQLVVDTLQYKHLHPPVSGDSHNVTLQEVLNNNGSASNVNFTLTTEIFGRGEVTCHKLNIGGDSWSREGLSIANSEFFVTDQGNVTCRGLTANRDQSGLVVKLEPSPTPTAENQVAQNEVFFTTSATLPTNGSETYGFLCVRLT